MTRVLQTAGINNVDNAMSVNKIREMVTFELGEEIEEVFRLVTTVGQRKTLSPHEESNLRPSDSALRICFTLITNYYN